MHEPGQQIPIEQVESEKDLGVTFERTLRFANHTLNCANARFHKTFFFIHGQRNVSPSL